MREMGGVLAGQLGRAVGVLLGWLVALPVVAVNLAFGPLAPQLSSRLPSRR
jgi:hypothetical protein